MAISIGSFHVSVKVRPVDAAQAATHAFGCHSALRVAMKGVDVC